MVDPVFEHKRGPHAGEELAGCAYYCCVTVKESPSVVTALDTPENVVAAIGDRISVEDVTGVIIQGGAKPKHVSPSPLSLGKKGKGKNPRKPR